MGDTVKRIRLKDGLAAASLALPSGATVLLDEKTPEFELTIPDRDDDPVGASQAEADARVLDEWEHADDATPAPKKPKSGGDG